MSFILLFLKGIIIGTAMIIPGVSGGVIAVIFGVYDKMIYSLTNIFKNFKENFIYLFYLGIGILFGMIFFSNIMLFFYNKYEMITKSAFIGLILGGVPYLFKEITNNKKERVNYKILAITFLLSTILFFISSKTLKINSYLLVNINIKHYMILLLCGFVYSIGKVIPGISGSFILIMFGMYEYILKLVSNPFKIQINDVFILIPFIIGFLIGIVFFLKLVNYLLKKYFKDIYSMIIGFVLGSIVVLIPTISSFSEFIMCNVILIICFIFSFKFTK